MNAIPPIILHMKVLTAAQKENIAVHPGMSM